MVYFAHASFAEERSDLEGSEFGSQFYAHLFSV